MTSFVLTPTLLDSQAYNSPVISPVKRQLSKLTHSKNHPYQTPIASNKENSQDSEYRWISRARSSCGKVSTKLYPSFCPESETRIMGQELYEQILLKLHSNAKETNAATHNITTTSSYNQLNAFTCEQSSSKATKEEIEKAQGEIVSLITKKKYKQAISKLFMCERMINKEHSISLRVYTKYLIILIYYKSGKYEKCIEAASKSIKCRYEFNSLATQYILHIKYLWAKSLCAKKDYINAINILIDITKTYIERKREVFSIEHLLMVKGDLGECYMVMSK